jgi:hypothetical protein
MKYAKYISIRKNWTTEQLTNVIFDEIFIKFDMFEFIVFDKESLFIFNF